MKKTARLHIDDYPEIMREQALLGELPPDIQAHIEASQGFAAFKAQRLADNAAILNQYPVQNHIEAIKTKGFQIEPSQKSQTARLFRVFQFATPIAAALLIVFFAVQPFISSSNQIADDSVRSKGTAQNGLNSVSAGQPMLEIWKRSDAQALPLTSGTTVQAFDKLQIAYHAKGKKYGVIISLDGSGKLTLHFPDSFDAPTTLRQGSGIVLPYAYQLDNAPRFERFFFVTSDEEFRVNRIWNLIERQLAGQAVPPEWAMEAALNLDPGFESSSFLLRK